MHPPPLTIQLPLTPCPTDPMRSNWLTQPMPYIIDVAAGELIVVHSIVPYEPRKRARDADEA